MRTIELTPDTIEVERKHVWWDLKTKITALKKQKFNKTCKDFTLPQLSFESFPSKGFDDDRDEG